MPVQLLRPFLGARILKTGLATFSVLVLLHWIGPSYVALAAVAAILTMQPSITDARRLFGEQMIGNLTGAFVGVLLALWLGSTPLAMALGVVLVLGILARLNLPDAANLAPVVLIFIMERPQAELLTYSSLRVAAITLGMMVGFLVNRYVRPPRFHSRLNEEMRQAGSEVDAFLERLSGALQHPESLTKEAIKSQAGAIQKRLETARSLLNLAEESDVTPWRRQVLGKVAASMFVFVESIMDIHKEVLRAGGIADPNTRSIIQECLVSVRDLRRVVMSATLDDNPAPPNATLSATEAAFSLQGVVDTLVDDRQTRSLGLTVHGVLGEVRHMTGRMKMLVRLMSNRSKAPAGQD